ncbi:hypothetical protein IPA_01850 [Ignicoccus pacificus DSM 13166]|uniref:Uncharacterized protein n=1 Tax=Ignicoccus pacificus DSM 13166 TaxID=940294 RepID=A0A977KAK2_9CREN|nr:hypothetical protein IPA_01850 [Ignicoccus pacificus DSM 13166]
MPSNHKEILQYRLESLKGELELAEKFLEENFVGKASGMTFEAWENVLGILFIKHFNELKEKFGEKAEEYVYMIPLTDIEKVSEEIANIEGSNINEITKKVLKIFEAYKDGPENSNVEKLKEEVREVIREVKEVMEELS